ncbi:UTRA domain-containing protein [Streptomyces atriruber]|uniref:UTRA domain-containing protein n=1 Tax=Streptomyces atriruber TaxID=545121 RepID=UPI00099EE7D1|nr:UTRA domain-containing protein [Streptomyces atriruber]
MTAGDERIIRTSPQRLSRDVWGAGRAIQKADVAEVHVDEIAAPDHVAQALGLGDGALVVRRSRTYKIDGQPVQMATSYLPHDLVHGTPITQADTGPGGTCARLAELGHAPAHFAEDVVVRPSTIDESDQLDLRLRESIIHITRTARDAAGRVVEINEMVLHPQLYRLRYHFDA